MTAPNMAAITESLQRSLQNCSLNHHHHHTTNKAAAAAGASSTSSDSPQVSSNSSFDATLELNSNISLPYHWEQCLDLKTGEVYYINWRTGMKAKEDPRFSGCFYSDEEDEDEDEDDESSYESEGSSSESSPVVSSSSEKENTKRGNVLVVGGCKRCLMYYMVEKQVEECPKCKGQLLHFDRSSDDNA